MSDSRTVRNFEDMSESNAGNPVSSSRGLVKFARRVMYILCRFGITARRIKDDLNAYLDTLESFNCRPTFPVTATALRRHPGPIRMLARRGTELAIHGYIHADYRSIPLEEQISHFKKAIHIFESLAIPFRGFRAPYLRSNLDTLEALRTLNLAYDSSRTIHWDVLDATKYSKSNWKEYTRLLDYYESLDSTCHLSLPMLKKGLPVIPVSIPDDEAMVDRLGITDETEIADVWKRIFQNTYSRGELFTIQLHPERIKFCRRALENVFRQARESQPKVWIASLSEISEWWKEKEGFTFETYTEGIGKWRVKANCSSKATILVRNCRVNKSTVHWVGGYQSVAARDFVVESATRPFVGVSPNASPDALNFLKGEGIIVEVSDQPQHFALYFDDLGKFSETDKKRVAEEIENSSAPLIRYWRWPEKAQSALAMTGDIDALTLIDFAMRIYEVWRQKIKQKLLLQNSTLRKLRYAILLIKVAGLMPFLRELKRQINSKTTFLGLEKTLEPNTVHVQCRTKYSLQPASRDDMEEILNKAKQEVGESARELLQRKWFYDCGFHDCYVARAAGSGDLCYIQWLVSSRDDSVVKRGFTKRLPRLKRDEILVENTFTFPQYRGNGIYPSVMVELGQIAKSKGFRRMLVYVREDNTASLKGCEKAGFRQFERISEIKLFFLTRRNHK